MANFHYFVFLHKITDAILSLTGNWTIELWFKATAYNDNNQLQYFIQKPGDEDKYLSNYAMQLNTYWDNAIFCYYFSGDARISLTDFKPTLNKWYHLAFIRDTVKSELRIVVHDQNRDEISAKSIHDSGTLPLTNIQDLLIGKDFTGYIDEVRISTCVRSFTALPVEDQLEFFALANMPSPKFGMGYTTDGDYLYAVSGGPGDDRSRKIERYNIADGSWSELADDLLPRKYCSAEHISSQNKIYLFNGATYTGASWSDTIDVIDLTDGSHTITTSNPYPVHYGGSAVWNDKIYVFGGNNGDGYSNRLYEYDPVTDTWTRLADMPESKQTNGEIVDGILYVFGGYNDASSTRIDAYNINENSWLPMGTMPTGVSTHATTVSGAYIWLVGDYSDLSFIAVYNTKTNEFKKLTSNMTPRRHAAAEVVGNKLYVYGGYNGIEVLDKLEAADISDYVTGMDEPNPDVRVENFTLEQNYPNPFNPSTNITYQLAKDGRVFLKIFNLLGKRMALLVDEMQNRGRHTVTFDGRNLSGGVYFYTLKSDSRILTRKMVCIR